MSEASFCKPCPFCGGIPEFENTDERARLRCTGCGTEGGLFFYSQDECESGLGDVTEACSIEAWNCRAESDLLQMLHECAEYIAALNGEQDDYCQRARALIARATGEVK